MRLRAFTLVEVLVALTILAAGMAVLLGTQANNAVMTERANRMAVAALLARSKLIDIEGELLAEGFSETDETLRGDFREEGEPEMEWEALVEVIEIPPEAAPEFAASINAQLFGGGDEGGVLSGSSAVSQMLPLIISEVPNYINQMAQRARRVTLTLTWPEGRYEETLTLQYYVADMVRDANDPALQSPSASDLGGALQGIGGGIEDPPAALPGNIVGGGR